MRTPSSRLIASVVTLETPSRRAKPAPTSYHGEVTRPKFDPRWEDHDSRLYYRAAFDDDAAAYDRTRPVAPPVVFDDIVELAGLHDGSQVLEIGPGTGQATRQLALRGVRVLGIELGPHLAEIARQNLADHQHVEVVTADFETWPTGGRTFDGVVACNSFHWINPTTRLARTASLLVPGGSLVHLSTPWVIPDDAERFWWHVQDDYVAVGGKRIDPATSHPDRIADFSPIVDASGLFAPSSTRRYPFTVVFSTEAYLAILSTQSGFKEFEPDAQATLLQLIGQRIDAQGGRVTAHLLALLTVAALP